MSGASRNNAQYCLITGATRGLGRALATAFWENGWSVLLVSRSEKVLNEVALSLGARETQTAHVIAADLAQMESAHRVIETVRDRIPRLDVLINNAAIQGPIGPLRVNNWHAWQETIQVDLLSPVALCRGIVPWMIETGGGSIINLSGGGAAGARAHFSAYATAKAGLVRFSETLAEELRVHQVRVNCVAPGIMATRMLEEIVAQGEVLAGQREYDAAVKTLREGSDSIQRAVKLILFLASGASKGITGKLISAVWDDWAAWPHHLEELNTGDVYTLRRVVGKDRDFPWGDK
jgi:3-oxoacyl-[acyl-carrier protein] reductase